MDVRFLRPEPHQLVVLRVWHLLCGSNGAVDVYREELPLQHGVPHDLLELCVRYDSRDVVLS